MQLLVVAGLQAFGGHLWGAELDYAHDMVLRDVRNNSAWNQRAFVLRHMLDSELGEWKALPQEQQGQQQLDPVRRMLARELEYVAAQVCGAWVQQVSSGSTS